jgi:hypothetical protein
MFRLEWHVNVLQSLIEANGMQTELSNAITLCGTRLKHGCLASTSLFDKLMLVPEAFMIIEALGRESARIVRIRSLPSTPQKELYLLVEFSRTTSARSEQVTILCIGHDLQSLPRYQSCDT